MRAVKRDEAGGKRYFQFTKYFGTVRSRLWLSGYIVIYCSRLKWDLFGLEVHTNHSCQPSDYGHILGCRHHRSSSRRERVAASVVAAGAAPPGFMRREEGRGWAPVANWRGALAADPAGSLAGDSWELAEHVGRLGRVLFWAQSGCCCRTSSARAALWGRQASVSSIYRLGSLERR